MKIYPPSALITSLLIVIAITGCAVENISPTAAIRTPIPTTAPTLEAGETGSTALTSEDLTESISTDDGVLTAAYPPEWSAEARGGIRLNLSNAPNLVNEIGRRTLLPGELAVVVVYLTRGEVASTMRLKEDFTLIDLAAATSGGVANTRSSSIRINGREAMAQAGEIGAQGVLTDAYAITYEVDGIFVTLTTYAAPGLLEDIRGITELLASNLTIDASRLSTPEAATD